MPLCPEATSAVPSAADIEAQFAAEVYPLLVREERGCVICHASSSGRYFLVDSNASATFRQAWSGGFLAVDGDDALLSRVTRADEQRMPLDGPYWEQSDIDILRAFSCELVRVTDAPSTCAGSVDPRAPALARLTRDEYNNTVRDLLGDQTRPADAFPEDDRAFGFDNVGSVQTTAPLHVERYYDATEALMSDALALPIVYDERFEAETLEVVGQYDIAHPGFPVVDVPGFEGLLYINDPGWVSSGTRQFPAGRYRITARAMGCDQGHYVTGACEPAPPEFAVVLHFAAGTEPVYEVPLTSSLVEYSAEVDLQGGVLDVRVGLTYVASTYRPPHLYLDWFDIEGPLDPPPFDPSRREAILTCDLEEGGLDCARDIMAAFGRKAWRRPVTADELDRMEAVVVGALNEASTWEESLRLALQSILLSPYFLYRVEVDSGADAHPLSPHELAARLSYFFWRTMPDAALASAADDGSIVEPAVLSTHIERLLADTRARSFSERLAAQWFAGDDVLSARPVGPVIPAELALSMKAEVELTFAELFETDADFRSILSADFTYVDEALAAHYGLPLAGVSGPTRVSLAGSNRLGLMTMGAPLVTNASENKGSIILRGKWLLDKVLCEAPAGPPANIPPLLPPVDGQSVRQALEAHRANPMCAGCHAQMDPLGFSLENYDQSGRYRSVDESGLVVDASGSLPDGRTFGDALELAALLQDDPAFERCVARHLVTYGLGQDPDEVDSCAVDALVEDFSDAGYSFKGLVRAFAKSQLFTQRRKEAAVTP